MLAYAELELIDEILALRRENAELRSKLAERDERIAALEATVAKLSKMLFGKKSEKMPRAKQEIDKQDGVQTDKEAAQKKRKKREEERKKLKFITMSQKLTVTAQTAPSRILKRPAAKARF